MEEKLEEQVDVRILALGITRGNFEKIKALLDDSEFCGAYRAEIGTPTIFKENLKDLHISIELANETKHYEQGHHDALIEMRVKINEAHRSRFTFDEVHQKINELLGEQRGKK